LSVFGFCSLVSVPAQAPTEKNAVLRSPFNEPAPTQASNTQPVVSTSPAYLKSLFNDAKAVDPSAPNARHLVNPDDAPDINADLKVTPSAGPWMIMIISYPGNDGAQRARKMCFELKTKNRVPAYVFVHGADERRKEYERVKKLHDDHQAFLRETNLTFKDPPRLAMRHIDIQHAVLIGGYADDIAANKFLTQVRGWAPPDPSKVDLETIIVGSSDLKDKKMQGQTIYRNPFKHAIIVRNPAVKQETPQEAKLDLATLRRLNADESLSLLNCKKPFTLAVKEFQTPHTVYDRATPASLWDKVGLGNSVEQKDFARINAHKLAESLRQLKLEAYVLHSKYSSTVTVGAFDGPNDPALKATQDSLAVRLNQSTLTQIQFFPRPLPMPVPR